MKSCDAFARFKFVIHIPIFFLLFPDVFRRTKNFDLLSKAAILKKRNLLLDAAKLRKDDMSVP